jgi:SAM-dependent methyltransferase
MAMRVDYDSVAADYSSRYQRNDYSGVTTALTELFASGPALDRHVALEVGCGTGVWLQLAREFSHPIVGIDPSLKMLHLAQRTAPAALLVRAQAESLPFQSQTFDRLFCVNALHHFSDTRAFFMEAGRLVRPGGAVLTIGLDPHTGRDRWWIYEYFPEALVADRQRYLPTQTIRGMMAAAGFERCETREVQHLPRALRLGDAENGGFLARTSTSQLMVISDEDYQAGLARIHTAAGSSPSELVLRADLTLYGTTGWRSANGLK